MFKIQKTEYVNKTFRIPKDLSERLSSTAQSEDISVNELVVQCCEYALSDLMPSDNEKGSGPLKVEAFFSAVLHLYSYSCYYILKRFSSLFVFAFCHRICNKCKLS